MAGFQINLFSLELLFCIVESLTPDDSLVSLRNTCKRLAADVPIAYKQVNVMQLLLNKVESWLHGKAVSLAPSLIFKTQLMRGHKERVISVKVGYQSYAVLWTVYRHQGTVHIVDSPAKAPHESFTLSITPGMIHQDLCCIHSSGLAFMSELSKKEEGSPTVTTIKIGRSKLETIMDENTATLAGQLLRIKDEIEPDDDYHDMSDDGEYGQHEQLSQDLPQADVIIIEDNFVVVADNHDVIVLD